MLCALALMTMESGSSTLEKPHPPFNGDDLRFIEDSQMHSLLLSLTLLSIVLTCCTDYTMLVKIDKLSLLHYHEALGFNSYFFRGFFFSHKAVFLG